MQDSKQSPRQNLLINRVANAGLFIALAAYAAAGVAGSSPLSTGVTAMSIAIGGFLVPFAFVYDPHLLLSGSPLAIGLTLLSAGFGATALAAAIVGYIGAPVPTIGRLLLAAAGVALLAPGLASDIVGLIVVGGSLRFWQGPADN